jgi:hypothetical protein
LVINLGAGKMLRNGPYEYIPGPNTLGIGIDNFALVRPGIATDEPNYGPRYNVRKSFAPLRGASQFPVNVSGPKNDLRHNGVYLSGDVALQALADFNDQIYGNKK